MKNHWTIQDYQLIQDNSKHSWVFMIFLMLGIIGIIIICYKFDFKIYEKYLLIKDNDQFLLLVNSQQIAELETHSEFYRKGEKYAYQIENISSDYSNMNGNIYQTIYINPYNYKTNAIETEIYLLKKSSTIYEIIIEFIKGGIG